MRVPRPGPLALVVALLLALHAWLAHSAMAEKGATYDEPLHLTAGYAYWTHGDYRLQPENGNLPQRWGALPLVFLGPLLPVEGFQDAWRTSDAPALYTEFFYGDANDAASLLGAARAAMLVWSLALGLLVFWWARALWGVEAGLFALAVHALSPTVLAHAPLVTSDMCAAFFLLASAGAYWRHLQRADPWTLALSGVTFGLAAVAKFSVVLLPFVFASLAMWRVWTGEGWAWRLGARSGTLATRGGVLGALALSTAVHAVLAWAVVWSFFGWRYLPGAPDLPAVAQYYRLWSFTLPDDGPFRAAMDLARRWRVLPEAYLHGLSYVVAASQERTAFLNAEFRQTGWWWFFPYAFVVKSSLAELLAFAAAGGGVIALWRRTPRTERSATVARWLRRTAPLVALLGVYGVFTVTSKLNIGHRHLLPMYPALLILASGLVALPVLPRRRLVAIALVALLAVESFAVRPHYLAFFNAVVGGPSNGWRHLVDSSLDWGQDTPGLARWLAAERQAEEPVYVSVFGTWDLAARGISGELLSPDVSLRVRPWTELRGGVYAVSATMLQNVYGAFRGPWSSEYEQVFQRLQREVRTGAMSGAIPAVIDASDPWGANFHSLDRMRFARLVNYLRLRTPDAVIGHTIFIHRLTDAEAAAATRGTTAEYVALLER